MTSSEWSKYALSPSNFIISKYFPTCRCFRSVKNCLQSKNYFDDRAATFPAISRRQDVSLQS